MWQIRIYIARRKFERLSTVSAIAFPEVQLNTPALQAVRFQWR